MCSDVTLSFSDTIIDTPRATVNNGGGFYLKSLTGTTTITMNSMTVSTASAGQSGGFIYVGGVNAVLNSNTMTISTSTANGGDGGVFCFENTGTTSVTMSPIIFAQTITAS